MSRRNQAVKTDGSTERCYCWDLRFPHHHTVADHRVVPIKEKIK